MRVELSLSVSVAIFLGCGGGTFKGTMWSRGGRVHRRRCWRVQRRGAGSVSEGGAGGSTSGSTERLVQPRWLRAGRQLELVLSKPAPKPNSRARCRQAWASQRRCSWG